MIVEFLQNEAIFESYFMVDSCRRINSGHFGIWIIIWVHKKGTKHSFKVTPISKEP